MELKPIDDYKFITNRYPYGEIANTVRYFAESDATCCEITNWERDGRDFDNFVKSVRSVVSRAKLPIRVSKSNGRIYLIKK